MTRESGASNFKTETSQDVKSGRFIRVEILVRRIKHLGLDNVPDDERSELQKYGYEFLREGIIHEAIHVFKAVQDFSGLQQVVEAEMSRKERVRKAGLFQALNFLEDHEGIRDTLNTYADSLGKVDYGLAFANLDEALVEYRNQFLADRQAPKSTGIINPGVDLVAIHNLVNKFDVAVPIASGGLSQGAIAHLWGIPTHLVDIAAHDRKTATGKWLDDVHAENFEDKRVLLFDKDAVTGATMQKAQEMLAKFRPANISAYFAYDVVGSRSVGTITDGIPPEVKIYTPETCSLENAGDVYIEAHERLNTQYGRRRMIERKFVEEGDRLTEESPLLAQALRDFIDRQIDVFDSLNNHLPGVSEIRDTILERLELTFMGLKQLEDLWEGDVIVKELLMQNFVNWLQSQEGLPLQFADYLVFARYSEKIQQAAADRNVENPHLPQYPVEAFYAAQKAVREGFEVAVIVGPEGFAYEPYFKDLGIETVAVNIPESDPGGQRSITIFDDLTKLSGRKVLVVEDDIKTGATLGKLIEHLMPHSPRQLGLYLGQPEGYQIVGNIPSELETVYMPKPLEKVAEVAFLEHLESKGLKLFKDKSK